MSEDTDCSLRIIAFEMRKIRELLEVMANNRPPSIVAPPMPTTNPTPYTQEQLKKISKRVISFPEEHLDELDYEDNPPSDKGVVYGNPALPKQGTPLKEALAVFADAWDYVNNVHGIPSNGCVPYELLFAAVIGTYTQNYFDDCIFKLMTQPQPLVIEARPGQYRFLCYESLEKEAV